MTIADKCPSCGGSLTFPPPDWGDIFTFFVTSTNIARDDILNLTYPQIRVYMTNAGKYISPFWGLGGATETKEPEKEKTVDDAMAFVSLFSGIG